MSKPLEGLDVVLSSPTYGPVDPCCSRDLRVATMSAAAMGLHWAGDASTDRQNFSFARNQAAASVRMTLKGELIGARLTAKHPDGIMWVDSDIRMQPDSIVRLLATVVAHPEVQCITGVYHARAKPYLPVLYHRQLFDEHGVKLEKYKYLQAIDYPKDKIMSVDACGFGFCYTSLQAIDTMARHPDFTKRGGWFKDTRDTGGYGEDIHFCDLAWKAGIQFYVDTGVIVGHTGDPHIIRAEDFRDQHLTIDSPELTGAAEGRELDWGATAKLL